MYSGVFSTDKRIAWKKTPIWNWERELKKKKTVTQKSILVLAAFYSTKLKNKSGTCSLNVNTEYYMFAIRKAY